MPTLTLPKAGGGFVSHSVPDVAQDVVLLASATQIISGKTLHPGSSGLMIALADKFPGVDGESVHFWRGSAGSIVADANALLVIEDDATAYIQFLTPNTIGPGILFGDPESNVAGAILYSHIDDSLQLQLNAAIRLIYTVGALAFQEATTISTTTAALTLSPAGALIVTSTSRVNDNVNFELGTSSDVKLRLRTTTISADEEITGVIEGTSNHQGVAANSLLVSNITDDGDMMFLVSDGGNSLEMIKMTAATAELSLGWGALKIGFGADLAAITRPATVTATAAAIITELINVGIFTA